ncbi:MAG: GNAT family N-acetyltransferase [Capsulimonadaceae bacterium]
MPRYEIRPFQAAEAETVAYWASDPEDVWRLTGEREGPVTAEVVVSWVWVTNYCFTLRCNGDLVAYAEVLEDDVENDVEIQHLIVAPDSRGAGVGRAMLDRVCAFLSAARPYREVWMRVGRDNEPGALCATAAGFVLQEAQSGQRYAWYRKALTPTTTEINPDPL